MDININLTATRDGVEGGEIEYGYYGYVSKKQKIEPVSFKEFFKQETGFELDKNHKRLYEIFELKTFNIIGIDVSKRVDIPTFFRVYHNYKNIFSLREVYESLILTSSVNSFYESSKYLSFSSVNQNKAIYNILSENSYNMTFFDNNNDHLSHLNPFQLKELINVAASNVRHLDGKVVVMNPDIERHVFSAFFNV